MRAIILAATYEQRLDQWGRDVPLPLVDVGGKTYLDGLVAALAKIQGLELVEIVTNSVLYAPLTAWFQKQEHAVPVTVVSDGTSTPETRLGAIGDLRFGIQQWSSPADLLVVGGHNWFTFDLAKFAQEASAKSPAVLVTAVPAGVQPRRFGWVQLDSERRIVDFREHAQTPIPNGALKASCVYYFAAEQLTWLDRFAETNSTNCTPGTFIAWLAGQTAVYGVPLEGAVYHLDGRHALRGADHLELQNVLRQRVDQAMSPWERAAAARLRWVASHLDLIDSLADPDVNTRVIAADLLGRLGPLVNDSGRDQILTALVQALADGAANDPGYGGSQSEDEPPLFVSATAACSLARLGYASDAAAVFAKARAAGNTLAARHNG